MNRLIKSTALGLSVLMGCSLCACGVTDSSLGQKTEINPGLWVEKEVALEPDSSDILALTTTTDGQLLCATVQSNGEASQKVDVLSSSDGYTWDTTPVYSVEVPGTCIEASLTESGVLVLTRTEDEEQIWYGAKETECSQVQPADSEVTDINNIQFVNSDSFLMAGRDTNNQSVAAIFSLRDGRMVTKVGAGTEWGGFAQHGDELAFISETGKLSTLKARAIRENNAKLVIIDPVQAFLGADVDMNRANEVRPIFRSLGDIAQATGCAIVLIGHLNKAVGTQSTYRGLGSIDITAAVRSLLFIGKLKDNPTTRVLIHEKSSLAPPGQSLAFSLGDEKGFEWIGAYDITADELLAGTDTAKTESKTAQAEMLILELLADGKKMPSAELEKAVNDRGISSRTMRTAKSRIGDRLVTEKDGTAWVCYLRS